MYLVKPLSRDKGKGQTHNVSALFALQISWCERGRYIVYLPFSLVPKELGALQDTWAIPKHIRVNTGLGVPA